MFSAAVLQPLSDLAALTPRYNESSGFCRKQILIQKATHTQELANQRQHRFMYKKNKQLNERFIV